MFIGYLDNVKYEYLRAGSTIPCEPTIDPENNARVWNWTLLYNSAIDIKATLPRECFVGAVSISFIGYTKIYSVEVYSEDGDLLGRYNAETGKHTTGEITVPVYKSCSGFTLRIHNAMSTISIAELRISAAYEDGEPLIWPQPKKASYGEGFVKLEAILGSGNSDTEYAAGFLGETLEERFGKSVLTPDGVSVKLEINKNYAAERYTISITEKGVKITASDRLTLLRACCVMTSLGCPDGFRISEIDDIPAKPMRGFHLGLPKRENIEFAKRLYRYVLLPLGYNQLFVQFCGGMRYERHPEITEAWIEGNRRAAAGLQPAFPHDYMGAEGTVLEKDEVRGLLDYAHELGFEIIPEVQSLGHVQYLTYAHPEIGERDENETQVKDTRAEDLRPSQFYTHCYCPSNEKSYELIFDIMDEIIEVSRPQRYLHIGHDEVYHLGVCPKCKAKPHHELFVGDVMRLYEFLKSRGLGTMMWGDMLQPTTKYETKQSINMLPRDIVQLDFIWYFHMDLDIEENLIEAGYPVMAGNLYSSHYPRYRKRLTNPKMLGGQVSSWCALNEHAFGKKGKFWDLTYTAEMLANPESYDPDMRPVYSYVIAKYIQPLQRDLIRGKYSVKGWSEKRIPMPKKADRTLPERLIAQRKSANLADGLTVKIDGSYERLAIEQATLHHGLRIPWVPLRVSGNFTLRYEDGEELIIPAEYAGGVSCLSHDYGTPFPEPAHRHTGYWATWFSNPTLSVSDGLGARLNLSEMIWENPYPEKKIESISYSSAENDFTNLILTGIKGLNRKK